MYCIGYAVNIMDETHDFSWLPPAAIKPLLSLSSSFFSLCKGYGLPVQVDKRGYGVKKDDSNKKLGPLTIYSLSDTT
jgi:hypothetical protein